MYRVHSVLYYNVLLPPSLCRFANEFDIFDARSLFRLLILFPCLLFSSKLVLCVCHRLRNEKKRVEEQRQKSWEHTICIHLFVLCFVLFVSECCVCLCITSANALTDSCLADIIPLNAGRFLFILTMFKNKYETNCNNNKTIHNEIRGEKTHFNFQLSRIVVVAAVWFCTSRSNSKAKLSFAASSSYI